jgi:hydrogenase maturation protease
VDDALRAVSTPRVLAVGIGNSMRGDDAAGVEVARRLRARLQGAGAIGAGIEVLELEGETLALLDAWQGASAIVLVDAVRSAALPGTLHRFDATSQPLPTRLRGSSSTHAFDVGETIELARALGRLPRQVVLHGVEGSSFGAGAGFSPAVAAAVSSLTEAVLAEARRLARTTSLARYRAREKG